MLSLSLSLSLGHGWPVSSFQFLIFFRRKPPDVTSFGQRTEKQSKTSTTIGAGAVPSITGTIHKTRSTAGLWQEGRDTAHASEREGEDVKGRSAEGMPLPRRKAKSPHKPSQKLLDARESESLQLKNAQVAVLCSLSCRACSSSVQSSVH